jgi:membrane protease YdiL (CAAX protease family)
LTPPDVTGPQGDEPTTDPPTAPDPSAPPDGALVAEPPPAADPPPARPGTSTFTIEGRAAPALFVIGWLATLIGLGVLFVTFQAGQSPARQVLLLLGLVALAVGLVAAAGSQGFERRARGVEAYRGPSPLLVFVAVIPLAALASVILAAPLSVVGVDLDGPLFRLLAIVAQVLLYVALIRLLVVDTGALTWSGMGIRRPASGSIATELLTGAVWALPVILVTSPIAVILSTLLRVTPESPLPPTGELGGFVLQFAAGALVAPIGEELFFRAFATTAWVRALGERRAIVRGGLFFAFVHVLTIGGTDLGPTAAIALIGFVTRIPVGIALSWLFVRRGTIWAPIGLHAAFNGTLLVLAELATRAGAPV